MEHRFLSLLYPTEESLRRHKDGKDTPFVSLAVCEELGLSTLLPLKSSSLSAYFSLDREVLAYRQATFAELSAHPELVAVLSEVLPILSDIEELRRLDNAELGTESYLYSITEIELYISCIEALRARLLPLRDALVSPAFKTLADVVYELCESEYYRDLNEDLARLSSRIHEVKSITVGVNLDSQLRPKDAGVISINAETFKSGKTLDKILRMSFKNDSFTCIADIAPLDRGQSDSRREAMQTAFHSAIDRVFRSSVRAWRAIVGEYVLDNTDFLLRLLPEIEFVSRVCDLERKLTERGYPLCTPTLAPIEEHAFRAEGLYNPDVALRIEEDVVANDLVFDENARLYVLTGPNRGGKSVVTCAVGLALAMAMLGMPTAAKALTLSPADAIYTHFPTGADDTIDKGRLGEECARLREILDGVTENSLILLDESLSSTGAFEASFIAAELLSGFSLIGCRGIFSTHLHELASRVAEINERTKPLGGKPLDSLVAGMEEGRRSFLIKRMAPDGKSYATDIAEKYGLSFESIATLLAQNEKGESK